MIYISIRYFLATIFRQNNVGQRVKVTKILSEEKKMSTKTFSKKACIFRLFNWTKVTICQGDESFVRHCFVL